METARPDEALRDFNRAIELNPAYTTALFNRAHLFEQRKEYSKAVADYDAILRVEPSNALAPRQKEGAQRKLEAGGTPLLTIATPGAGPVLMLGEPSTPNCGPFGCPWHLADDRPPLRAYQQVYAAEAFGSKPVTIKALTFYAKLGRAGKVVRATYSVRLAGTDARVGHLDAEREKNIGGDAVLFWSGVLEQDASGGSFTITGTKPFRFDPAAGKNLVLDIGITGQTVPPKSAPVAGLFDRDRIGSTVTSRAFFVTDKNGFNNASGLVTGFTLEGVTSGLAVPKLLSPAAGAVLEHFPRETTVVWVAVPGAAAYTVEWDFRDESGWASERNGALSRVRATEPVATFRFVGAQPGRWRVCAVDAAGKEGPKSEWREFRYTK